MPDAIDEASLTWMPKSVWGPIKWKELHVRGLVDLPMENEQLWFSAFVAGLPCPECRQHFKEFLSNHPPDFSSRQAFFSWTVAAHNHVNQATGKPSLSSKQAYETHRFDPDELDSSSA
jgi:hypothetical protein